MLGGNLTVIIKNFFSEWGGGMSGVRFSDQSMPNLLVLAIIKSLIVNAMEIVATVIVGSDN